LLLSFEIVFFKLAVNSTRNWWF